MATTEQQKSPNSSNVKRYTGGCLCGAVRFEADLDLTGTVSRCNCTICTKLGATAISGKPSIFRLISGAESVGEHRTRKDSPNQRNFCKQCGTHCFGSGDVPEIGGAFVSVYVNCLDNVDLSKLDIQYWDGFHDNWAAGLRKEPWPRGA